MISNEEMIIMEKKNLYLEQLRPFRMAYVRQTGPYGPSNRQHDSAYG